jgi:predicted dehydrogenase
MDVALIGSSGHTGYVTNEMDHPAVTIVGVAPGSAGEDVSDLYQSVSEHDASISLYESVGELLEEEQPDVAAISCQFSDLASVSEQALEMGVHVFTEKPLATTLADLESLRDTYEESDAELVGMFGIRYDPWFYTAYRRIEDGAIGDVRLLYGQKSYRLGTRPAFYRSRETYGGTIPWVGIHAIDWINWVTDADFRSVHARHSSQHNRDHGDLETSGVVTLELTDEVLATVSVDYYRPETAPTHGDDQLRVVGTDGVITVRDEEVYLINDGHEGERRLQQESGGSIFPDFLSMLAGESECLITAEESFRATEVCLKARESADEGTTISL